MPRQEHNWRYMTTYRRYWQGQEVTWRYGCGNDLQLLTARIARYETRWPDYWGWQVVDLDNGGEPVYSGGKDKPAPPPAQKKSRKKPKTAPPKVLT